MGIEATLAAKLEAERKANARLRAEVERLRNACTHALTMLQSTGLDASWTVLAQWLADALAREDGAS